MGPHILWLYLTSKMLHDEHFDCQIPSLEGRVAQYGVEKTKLDNVNAYEI